MTTQPDAAPLAERLQAELADARHEIARLKAIIEQLEIDIALLRKANKSLGRPWATREGERE